MIPFLVRYLKLKFIQKIGAVKITPSHDFNDYETALRHNLNFKTIFNDDGCLVNVPAEFMVNKIYYDTENR